MKISSRAIREFTEVRSTFLRQNVFQLNERIKKKKKEKTACQRGVYSRALNVSFAGNEILNFNREINRVFHSHGFSVGHGKLLCFSPNSPLLLVPRANKLQHRTCTGVCAS